MKLFSNSEVILSIGMAIGVSMIWFFSLSQPDLSLGALALTFWGVAAFAIFTAWIRATTQLGK